MGLMQTSDARKRGQEAVQASFTKASPCGWCSAPFMFGDRFEVHESVAYHSDCWPQVSDHDPVVRPSHYTHSRIEVWDAIDAWGLNYFLGNVVKYVARADRKDDAIQDLQKAKAYIEREIRRRALADFKRSELVGAVEDNSLEARVGRLEKKPDPFAVIGSVETPVYRDFGSDLPKRVVRDEPQS